jgi:uncharacterized phage protein (TIGR01671 family)
MSKPTNFQQREIKFRAWDGKQMLTMNTEKYGYPTFECKDGYTWLCWNDYDLMQYTGLNDKDGQEIYEGDVVENHHPEKTSGIYIVRFSLSDFGTRFEIVNHTTGLNRWWKEATCRVIGNIYENPELTKL